MDLNKKVYFRVHLIDFNLVTPMNLKSKANTFVMFNSAKYHCVSGFYQTLSLHVWLLVIFVRFGKEPKTPALVYRVTYVSSNCPFILSIVVY